MAFKSNDGTEFTNRPAMTAHNARSAQSAKHMQKAHKKDQSQGGSVSCPHCGGKVELHPADTDQSQSMGTDDGMSSEF